MSDTPTSGTPIDPTGTDPSHIEPTGLDATRADVTLPEAPPTAPEHPTEQVPAAAAAGPSPTWAPGPTAAPVTSVAQPPAQRRGPTWELVTIGTLALLFAGWLIVAQIYQISIDLRAYSTLATVGLGLVLLLLGLVGVTRRSQPPR